MSNRQVNDAMKPTAERMPALPNAATFAFEIGANISNDASASTDLAGQSGNVLQSGLLILNADDWGRDQETTDRIYDCVARRTVSSVSAMVFMKDSTRAASIARERTVDTGLHLNFTTPFSGQNAPSRLNEHQRDIAAYLNRRRLNQVVF